MPLSANCTTRALSAVDIRSTPSTLPEFRLRIRYQPPPLSTSCHRWSAVPLSANCTTRALSAVDIRSTPSTLPEFRLRITVYGAGGDHGCPVAEVVGKAVIRSRAAPIGIRVTVSTGAVLRAGLSWSGVTTCWLSACHCSIRRAGAVILTGVPSRVKGLAASGPPVAVKTGAPVSSARP